MMKMPNFGLFKFQQMFLENSGFAVAKHNKNVEKILKMVP